MRKRCSCGDIMTVKLRTVIYSGKVEIDNVPIYSCPSCSRSEVFPEVKSDLTGLIGQLGEEPKKQTFLFNEWNEWANLLVESVIGHKMPDLEQVERLIEERIDELLDLYLIACRLGDEAWKADLNKRLSQISRRYTLT
ncbi:hypothetical protein IJ21_20320 [Paenibacillus sp. 32O-W]|uniref:YgiT-type zinc finger protein n=1 Tax=Paenibacillus cisolokensis TaxID=1658519 RepID=A0ABQ4MZX5_9BACL|nr:MULTISPECIES: hypothetical protein [Paenibacillus]ALS27429.1 hypothetical protein IJ21_20320 [Paenibacillus sp. 32O-W]GIQ61467.1 hypothetical protein PACILC2_00350 [Paenibacillus cisolokensis]